MKKVATTRKLPKSPQKTSKSLIITGISAQELINIHFGTVTTFLERDDNIQENSKCLSKKNSFAGETVQPPRDDDADFASHETDKIGKRAMYFFDSKKSKVKAWPTMIDITQNGPLPLYTNKPCRNCHHSYSTHPIGCPIKYNPNLVNDSDPKRKMVIKFLQDHNFSTETNDFFETEHMFCQYTCVKSYICKCLSINPHSQKYRNSISYLTLMYKKIHGLTGIPKSIPCAPPLDILDTYGGHLSIKEWRAISDLLIYDETVNIRRPYMFSCSTYFEETKARI